MYLFPLSLWRRHIWFVNRLKKEDQDDDDDDDGDIHVLPRRQLSRLIEKRGRGWWAVHSPSFALPVSARLFARIVLRTWSSSTETETLLVFNDSPGETVACLSPFLCEHIEVIRNSWSSCRQCVCVRVLATGSLHTFRSFINYYKLEAFVVHICEHYSVN